MIKSSPKKPNQIEIKICGITRSEDARLAIEHGATALGFIFAESPRSVTPAAARLIVDKIALGPVQRIGVFVKMSAENILEIVDLVGLTGVQLHSAETTELAKQIQLKRPELRILRTLFHNESVNPLKTAPSSSEFLFDSIPVSGATKSTEHLLALATSFNEEKILRPHSFFIAGGLNSENVGTFIKLLRPTGVDISSGVESKPGVKDPESLKAFISAVEGV
jgi:phosphoribosylanthranilate isomerase